MLKIIYLVLSCLSSIVRAVDKFDQIGLKKENFQFTSVRQQRFGYIFHPPVDVSLEQAAILCLGQCVKFDKCRSIFKRFWGFKQDDKIFVKFDISQEEIQLASTLPFNKDLELEVLGLSDFLDISLIITEGMYYAYNMALPSFPQKHNLQLSSIPPKDLNIIRDIENFESLKEWRNKLFSLAHNFVQRGIALTLFRGAIISTFLQPQRNAVPSLLVNKILWRKSELAMMVQHILNKQPLDDSMVFTYAKATLPYFKLHATDPETLADFEVKNDTRGKPLMVGQAFKLSKGHWIILKWNLDKDDNTMRAISTKPFDKSLLEIQIIQRYLDKVSKKLGIKMPEQNEPILVYTKCPEGDEAFCAIFLNASCSFEFVRLSNIDIPDEIRLWMAYDLMQRFGLTANDIDKVGMTAKPTFQGDVGFNFMDDLAKE
ncbi:hypothetical protein NEOLI_001969 [Neolecta irregularis DAH-3]|uniref:Uncharacterized protein n=1 Tax=Neolecta irregularis (strain DAH-3) TaxID=1198029 RepID=A0A1U7LLC7_NEOID|nr:hypothetical protein NEOLI_001969 [Neolecta irregularis DAH-3]|eukprot:OLL23460.1 hypothetical protein NEOLI_001969 [Neolecta irregularis DAH-3]